MTVKIEEKKSRYWFISSPEIGDIGLDMLTKVNERQALAYYQEEMLDFVEDIEIFPTTARDLYLSNVDIL